MVHPIERSLTAFVCGGVFERFPRLTIVSAENDVAWLPFFLYRIDKYAARGLSTVKLPLKPSEYIKRQVYATFINDDPNLSINSPPPVIPRPLNNPLSGTRGRMLARGIAPAELDCRLVRCAAQHRMLELGEPRGRGGALLRHTLPA